MKAVYATQCNQLTNVAFTQVAHGVIVFLHVIQMQTNDLIT